MSLNLPASPRCTHSTLCFSPSAHAAVAGYRRPPPKERLDAASTTKESPSISIPTTSSQTRKRKRTTEYDQNEPENQVAASWLPAPLVLPGDDLAQNPNYPPQSLQEWLDGPSRNEVTKERNVIYLAAPPDVESDVAFVRAWSDPQLGADDDDGEEGIVIPSPRVQDVADYLAAFYYLLPVKLLPERLKFTGWKDKPKSRSKSRASKSKPGKPNSPAHIGLNTSTEIVRIRTRASKDGAFLRQLNLDDLLDSAISVLPDDAYALLLLVEHDLYEDDDDLFVCGRAYGGSRVAVISTARYHPSLDRRHGVERGHAWPASHCASYMNACCEVEAAKNKKPTTARTKKGAKLPSPHPPILLPLSPSAPPSYTPPMLAAVTAATTSLPGSHPNPLSPTALSTLHLSRICRTASHELGHCFGIDHCVYSACVMQGSASLAEDVRQPPYLCLVDLSKIMRAIDTIRRRERRLGDYMYERYEALREYCRRFEGVERVERIDGGAGAGMFKGFGEWIKWTLADL
jgi:archaemetzincin